MPRIARTRVYYTLCGTNGKDIEYSYLHHVKYKSGMVILCDKNGKENGWMPLKHCFFTREQAKNDWRRRSCAETTEHADVLEKVANEIQEKAEKIRKNARVIGKWQDL